MDYFGCCSSYMDCSDALECLHREDAAYTGCAYRRKLEKGIVFYGKNAGRMHPAKEHHEKSKNPRDIYLACFGQLFVVRSWQKGRYSYKLSEEQAAGLRELFERQAVPYRMTLDFQDRIDGEPIEDDSPCYYQAVVSIDGQEYSVRNFNMNFIKQGYAERISKAFNRKGISCRCEKVGYGSGGTSPYGSWKYVPPSPAAGPKQEEVSPTAEEKPDKPSHYVQGDIFEILLRQRLGEMAHGIPASL